MDGADGKAIAAVLSGGAPRNPFRWPASETIRAPSSPARLPRLARIRDAEPSARPELAAAMAAGGDASIQIAIVPSTTLRRSIEESIAGSAPRARRWSDHHGHPGTCAGSPSRLAFEPRPTDPAVVQAKDADAAKALMNLAQDALDLLAKASRNDPATGLVGHADQPDEA